LPTPHTYTFTLSLHDALPIYHRVERAVQTSVGRGIQQRQHVSGIGSIELSRLHVRRRAAVEHGQDTGGVRRRSALGTVGLDPNRDRKSTRLNSSHVKISYAVF